MIRRAAIKTIVLLAFIAALALPIALAWPTAPTCLTILVACIIFGECWRL